MPLMNVFEPLFVGLLLVAIVTLAAAIGLAIRGRFARVARLLRRLGLGAAVYFVIVIVVSMFNPQRVYRVGDTQCFDDWCIAVAGAGWTDASPGGRLEVLLRLSNRARRVPMGETGTTVYVIDANGRRFDPVSDPGDVGFDTVLQPGESKDAARRFDVPRDTPNLSLIYTHHRGFPIGWFIITEGGWFQKPPVVRLN
jgi:hypothetical protein